MLLMLLCSAPLLFAQADAPLQPPRVRIGVVGLVHTHVHWLLGREDRGDVEIVGIVEPNRELAQQYSEIHGFSMDIVYDDLETMLEETNPHAVTAFNTIRGHLDVVKACAPRGIHVMVEKPLAVSLEHAREMAALAREHEILLLTNYETTWYGSNHDIYELAVKQGKLGPLRKVVVHDGHAGPIEIGCNPEFTDWLCDPYYNGAGALTDFGCYGANLMTWLMEGQRPQSVLAVTQQIKPDIYPNVDDEATIILTYPEAQAIIQASWNWPFARKDMEVYGKSGMAIAQDGSNILLQLPGEETAQQLEANPRPYHINDPFTLLAEAVLGNHTVQPTDLSSLENNLIVMEILDAAMRSAKTGQRVELE